MLLVSVNVVMEPSSKPGSFLFRINPLHKEQFSLYWLALRILVPQENRTDLVLHSERIQFINHTVRSSIVRGERVKIVNPCRRQAARYDAEYAENSMAKSKVDGEAIEWKGQRVENGIYVLRG